MNARMLGRIATTSLMLGIATVGCTSTAQMSHPMALADQAQRGAEAAARFAAKASAALTAHRAAAAVDAAEKAVAGDPSNAGYRLLLGRSYLAAGRFASAGTSFRDSLTLSPDQPKARFYLALSQIAQGRGADALPALHGLDDAVPAADLGLALALAGDRQTGIQKLIDLVRSGKSDARGRQNLALAFALDGRWREARAVAMQDTPPDRINDQIAGWAELARPQAGGAEQVAMMLGVKPVVDSGLPTALALATPMPALPTVVAPPVAVAVAVAAPTAMPVAAVAAEPVMVPIEAPLPVATPSNASAAAVVLAAQESVKGSDLAPPSLLRERVALTPRVVPDTPAVPVSVPAPRPVRREGGYVVQLGAYARASAMESAWSRASRLMPRLAGYAPVRAEFRFAGGSLVRLSVAGFGSRADAVQLCQHIHAAGGQCFVRSAAGDSPLQWVRRNDRTQIASR